jgi:hypothetical protein
VFHGLISFVFGICLALFDLSCNVKPLLSAIAGSPSKLLIKSPPELAKKGSVAVLPAAALLGELFKKLLPVVVLSVVSY